MPRPPIPKERIDMVEAALVQGATTRQIATLCEQKWDIGPKMAAQYVKRVEERWEKEGVTRGEEAVRHIYQKALQDKDTIRALRALQILDEKGDRRSYNVKAYKECGDPPVDPLGGVSWLRAMLLVGAREVALDPKMDPASRRDELRKIARGVAGLLPQDEIHDALGRLGKHIEDQQAAGDVEMEAVTDGAIRPVALRADSPRRHRRR